MLLQFIYLEAKNLISLIVIILLLNTKVIYFASDNRMNAVLLKFM